MTPADVYRTTVPEVAAALCKSRTPWSMPIHSMQAAALVEVVEVAVEAVPRLPSRLPFGRQQSVFPGSTFNSKHLYVI